MSLYSLMKLVALSMPRISWIIPGYQTIRHRWLWLRRVTMLTIRNPSDGHPPEGSSQPASTREKVTATVEELRSQGPPNGTNIEIDGCAQHGADHQQQHKSSLMVDSNESDVETQNDTRQNEGRMKLNLMPPRQGQGPQNQEYHPPPRSQSDLIPKRQLPCPARQVRSGSRQRDAGRATLSAPKLRVEPSDESRKVTKNGPIASRCCSTAIGVRRGSCRL
ncbi:hypothetical protein AB1N83_006182 [Pleurotus pulmonarius]